MHRIYKMLKTKVAPFNRKTAWQSSNMYKSMKIPHIIGSCLGTIPTQGLTSDSPEKLHFNWISFRMTYMFILFTLGMFFLITDIASVVDQPMTRQLFGKYNLVG